MDAVGAVLRRQRLTMEDAAAARSKAAAARVRAAFAESRLPDIKVQVPGAYEELYEPG